MTEYRHTWRRCVPALLSVAMLMTGATALHAQATQRQDEEYTRLIRQHLTDPRITTDLVDHLPFSDKVPTTLKFPGINRIVGTPGYLTHAADIHRYLKAVADAAPTRAKFWTIGKSPKKGRDMVVLAIADEETHQEPRYSTRATSTSSPIRARRRRQRAKQLFGIAKPVYYLTSGIHSTETGGPEMLMELAYRLVVDETAR